MDINGIIQRLDHLIEKSGRVPGTQRRIVEKGQLESIVEDLRNSIPGELREAAEILRQRESIINQANMEAERVRSAAKEESEVMRATAEDEYRAKVSETEITKQAQKKGEGIVNEAQRSGDSAVQDAQRRAQRMLDETEAISENRRAGADQYAREVLFNLEERVADILTQVRKGLDVLGTTKIPPK